MSVIMNARDGQSRWGHSEFSRIKKPFLSGVYEHIVLRIPRTTFRQCGITFSEIKQSDQSARYWEMAFELFLEMLRSTENSGQEQDSAELVMKYPFQKVYLEWVPSKTDKHRAECYLLHAFLMTDILSYGSELKRLLQTNDAIFFDNQTRPANSRKPDELAGLQQHQHFKRVNSEVYYRNICSIVRGDRYIENNLDNVLSHGNKSMDKSPANPSNIFTLRNACKQCKNDKFRSVKLWQVNDTYTFPNAENVIRLSPQQLCTKIFCSKYLPDYQAWFELYVKKQALMGAPLALSDNEEEEEDIYTDGVDNITGGNVIQLAKDEPAVKETRFDLHALNEYDMRTTEELEQERIEAFTSRSDWQIMLESTKSYYTENVQPHEGTEEFRDAYLGYQQWAIQEVKSRCFTPDANISEKGKVILSYMNKRTQPRYNMRKYDTSLSVFANRLIRHLEEFEQDLLISTNQLSYYRIMCGRLDAYRHSFGLHWNQFQTGESATSKSFLFDLMEKNSIPNTIDVLTYQTAKSDAVDGNRNDVITVFNEAPPGMFLTSKNKNLDSSAEAMFKERLTSQHVSCKTFYIDESTGKRSQRISKSECIGVVMGATNDDPSDVAEALKSRFFWGNFERTKRHDKDIDDCMNGERNRHRYDLKRLKNIGSQSKETQARVWMIFKLIWMRVIKDVEMCAANVLLQRFKKRFESESIRAPEPRDWERVTIQCKIQAILTAITTVFEMPGGEHYNEPFVEEHLLDVEKYLVVTEEMVWFVLTLLSDQFVHPAEHKILNKIFMLHAHSPKYGIPNIDGSSEQQIDYSYLKLPGKMGSVAKVLHSNLDVSAGKTSLHNITGFLKTMTSSSVESKKYKAPVDGGKWATINKNTKKKRMQSAFITGDAVFIHMSYIDKHRVNKFDPVMETIEAISHYKQKQKRCIVARRFNNSYHIMRVITRKPNNAKLNFRNVLYNTKESKIILGTDNQQNPARQYSSMSINEDIDDWAFNKRASILGLPSIPSTDQIGVVSGKPQITYPDACKRKSITHGLKNLGPSKQVLSVKRKVIGTPQDRTNAANQMNQHPIKKHKLHANSSSVNSNSLGTNI
jgi:hypothetical protein